MKSQNGRRWAQSAGCCDAAFPQQTVMSRTNIRRATPQHRPAGPARPPSWLDTVSHLHLHQIYDATEKTVSSFIENFVLATLLSCAAYFFNAEALHTLISAIIHPPHRTGKQIQALASQIQKVWGFSCCAWLHDPGVYSQLAVTDVIWAGRGLASSGRSQGSTCWRDPGVAAQIATKNAHRIVF